MPNDDCWAGAHLLCILSHVGLFFSGTYFFIFAPMTFDVPSEVTITLPWATSAFGLFGAISTASVYSWLANADEITALDPPRQLYGKRRVAVIGAFVVLAFFCVGDLALAVKFSAAASTYDLVSSFWAAAVIACLAGSLCVVSFITDLSKLFGQWRQDFLDSLELEENQEDWSEDEARGSGGQPQVPERVGLLQLEEPGT